MAASNDETRKVKKYAQRNRRDILRKLAEAKKYLQSQTERRERLLSEPAGSIDTRF